MTMLSIPCPKCGKKLKLKDRNLLGRKGRCPRCQHAFILTEPTEPDEVEFQLADSAAPAVGTSAQWVPESAPPAITPTAPPSTDAPPAGFDALGALGSDAGGAARLREIRRRNAKRRNMGILVGVLTAVAAVGVYAFAIHPMLTASAEPAPPKPRVVNQERAAEKQLLRENAERAQAESPTNGQPIDLRFVPFGARIVIHLRPAELWQPGSLGEETRYCLGPFGIWAEQKIKELCRRDPAQIEEALICLIPRMRGTPPDVAVVVRLVEEAKRSELIMEFQAARNDEFGEPVYLTEDRAYLIHDLKTFAVGPRDSAQEMADAVQAPNIMSDGIDALLAQTDSQRHLTVLFEPRDVRQMSEFLVPSDVMPFFEKFLDWFDDNQVETVAWSFHLEDQFYSELLLRNRTFSDLDRSVITERSLQSDFKDKLDRLPRQLLEMVRHMQPRELGRRKIVGRFPAMSKVFALATTGGIRDRCVQFVTPLPDRAAPNLALASLLTWDESTRTDFSQTPQQPQPSSKPNLPDRIADRLSLPIDAEFNRTPLQDAFAYISDEIKVPIEIDGDALKFAGYTKNMPQTFDLGTVPALTAIAEILKNYEQMVIVVDEQKKVVTVMTRSFAKNKGLSPYPVPVSED